MSGKFIASVDQGTTGTRFALFNERGEIVAISYEEHSQIYPRPGWVEHEPLEIWQKTQEVIREALKTNRIEPKEIVAIGVTNQRETTIVWDRETGKPYHKAVVWQCTRTEKICERLRERGLESLVRNKTGLYIHSYFSAPKLKWILDNVPNVRRRAEEGRAIFGTVDTWLIWNLTGGPHGGSHTTDYTNASRTMLMDLQNLEWNEELVAEMDIPFEMLPEIHPSSNKESFGHTDIEGVFKSEIPILGDIGDQQAALVGQTCFDKGDTKNTYGTGCFMLMNVGTYPVKSEHGLVSTCAYSLEKKRSFYALEGAIAIAGAAIQWLRDNLKIIDSAEETEGVARAIADEGASGIYLVPAFSGLFAPYWDMSARGCIVGITGYIRREHLIHAALDAICFQTRDIVEAMRADLDTTITEIKADGGAATNNYLMQLQANVLGANVIRPAITQTTSLGAAYIAGLASEFWNNIKEIKQCWKTDRVFTAEWSNGKREKTYMNWKKAVERSRKWVDN